MRFGDKGPTVVGGEDLRGTEHVVEVVHRLALSHEDDVGELVHIGKGIDLVEDVGCRETALKTLFARLTEQAVHLAAHLRRHTQRGAVAVGDIDRLDKLMAELLLGSARIDGEQVFDRPVLEYWASMGAWQPTVKRWASSSRCFFDMLAISLMSLTCCT